MTSIAIGISEILKGIWGAASTYLARPRSRVENLHRDAELLNAKLVDFNGAIERNGQTVTEETRLWKLRAETFLSTEVDAIQRDYRAMRCLGGWSWNCVSINRRVTKKLEEVKELISQVDVSKVATTPPPPAMKLSISNNVVGMQSNLIQIVKQIRDENASVIGIYGMGGIGKTTLLKLINNHEEISKLMFEHVVWIVASKGCKLQKLQMDLAKKVGLNLKDEESEDDRASKLCDFLKEKNCLLFLDDIWELYDLNMLGMEQVQVEHGKEQKRKVVVFTTRSEQVCTEMRVNMKKKVKGLTFDQAWELFLKYAGEDVINSELAINRLAKEVAKECTGVPLALITVGRAMSAKRSWEVWNDALTQLKLSQMPKVTGMRERDPMFAAFKLSYDSLEDDNMRARLLCCSLWPEDFEIDKVELIQCWIGLGLIDEFDSINRAFHRGHSHIETLTNACLLELVEEVRNKLIEEVHPTKIKMHDVIRDMALWIASDCESNQRKWIVISQAGLRQLELKNEEWQVVERASFMHNKLTYLPRQTATFPKLSVLMLQQNKFLDFIPKSFFLSLPVLTFLDLSYTMIRELPREINMLSELQHLNLSFTKVEALPIELSSLAKLKYLLLERTWSLAQVPKGTISNLPLLKLLDLYKSKYTDLGELEGFQGCRKNIGITLHSMIDLERLGSLSQLSIWKLQLRDMRDLAYPSQLFENIMRSHNTRLGLERLDIVNVTTGGKLAVAQSNKDHQEGLECLRYMTLITIDDLLEITWKEVQPQMVFPNLHELTINNCKMLRNITGVFQLPNLSILRVSNCGEMEELISCVGSSVNSGIGLRSLFLYGLPKLNCISRQLLTFPYLERINVFFCPELRKLPFGAEICQNKLKGIVGEVDWWENIQWKDINDKNSLAPYFKFVY
ncbi:probable disease resistance protein At1g61300 [Zingiber officinale]|uniref:probable disease resistance protein At1g61300 n=1 Tax=Zingiber officinale TaxID=94328 RepID=UPI001C4D1930|nr:probable disease resistance protein At1g61300 [Zingiber officinale]